MDLCTRNNNNIKKQILPQLALVTEPPQIHESRLQNYHQHHNYDDQNHFLSPRHWTVHQAASHHMLLVHLKETKDELHCLAIPRHLDKSNISHNCSRYELTIVCYKTKGKAQLRLINRH